MLLYETVDAAIRGLLQAPGATQINHAKALRNRLGSNLARKFVRRRKENDIHAGVFHLLPGETVEGKTAISRKLGIRLAKIRVSAALAVAPQQ